jgi:hypothetical protein
MFWSALRTAYYLQLGARAIRMDARSGNNCEQERARKATDFWAKNVLRVVLSGKSMRKHEQR